MSSTYSSSAGQPALNNDRTRGELGIYLMERTAPGVVITRVTPGSAAAQAGLREGDVVMQVNGKAATTPLATAQLIRQIPIGQTGTLMIWRDGDQRQVQITMQAARPMTNGQAANDMDLRETREVGFSGDAATRLMKLEQQVATLTQDLAQMRQDMAALRAAGIGSGGVNVGSTQATTPAAATGAKEATPAVGGSTPIVPPPTGGAEQKTLKPVSDEPKSVTPPASDKHDAGPTPAAASTPAAGKDKSLDDLFKGTPKANDKTKSGNESKGTDELFK